MRLVNRLSIGLLLTAAAAFAQYPIPGSSGGGGGGGGCVAGTGITCVGSTISVDTAVIQSRATAQAGTSTYCRSTTGSATMTCALTPTLTAYTTGSCLSLNADFANVTTATLDVDALGAKSVLNRSGAALAAGDIPLNKPVGICYDGTQWIVQGNGASSITSFPANAQTGTTYTVLTGDRANVVTFSNAGAIAVTLPQAGVSFPDGWFFYAKNIGAGDVTITPTTSTISGAASITLSLGEFALITSNGTNYEAQTNRITTDSALSITRSRTAQQIGVGATVATLSGSQVLTNKTISEADNIITLSQLLTFTAANCQGTSAFTSFATPTANAPAAACVTGTNTNYGTLAFDDSTDESVQYHFPLASDWTGNIDLAFRWRAAATSGDVIWAVQTACVADGETGDPSFNAASTVTDTAKGTTLQFNDASISAITVTGCAAGEELMFRLYRDADAGGDTMTGDAQLIWARFTTRRAQ